MSSQWINGCLSKCRLAWRYGSGLAGLRRHDVILASFPKSGSTWLRFFFANLAYLLEGCRELIDFSRLNNMMPELGVSNLLLPWPHAKVPRVVKTHLRYSPLFLRQRVILVLRDPRDVMVSYYHFERNKRIPRFTGSFSEFIRHRHFGLPAWFRHTSSWINQAGLTVRYEQLRRSDLETFSTILAHLGVDVTPEALTGATERSRFQNVRKIETRFGHGKGRLFKEGFRFSRRGESGGWREHFSDEDRLMYRALCRRYELDLYPDHQMG